MPKIEMDLEELKELIECAYNACTECSGPQSVCDECIITKCYKKFKEGIHNG